MKLTEKQKTGITILGFTTWMIVSYFILTYIYDNFITSPYELAFACSVFTYFTGMLVFLMTILPEEKETFYD